MLEFDEERFVRIQSQAVSHADALHDYIRQLLGDGIERVVFAGAGGAGILMRPAAALLHAQSSFPAVVEYPAELLLSGTRHVGPSSLVVVPSLSGTTKEAVE